MLLYTLYILRRLWRLRSDGLVPKRSVSRGDPEPEDEYSNLRLIDLTGDIFKPKFWV
jgi:hypothetical protein